MSYMIHCNKQTQYLKMTNIWRHILYSLRLALLSKQHFRITYPLLYSMAFCVLGTSKKGLPPRTICSFCFCVWPLPSSASSSL